MCPRPRDIPVQRAGRGIISLGSSFSRRVASKHALSSRCAGSRPGRVVQASKLRESKTAVRSTPALDSSSSRYPAIILQSAAVSVAKNESISATYENRTKTAKCGGLETNGPRERISGPDGCAAVRRFVREARGYWQFQRAKTQRRMLVSEGLAEGVILQTKFSPRSTEQHSVTNRSRTYGGGSRASNKILVVEASENIDESRSCHSRQCLDSRGMLASLSGYATARIDGERAAPLAAAHQDQLIEQIADRADMLG